ncbi:hypothetical protein DL767_000626 [Monosporascus sp. MG133]|nr:hypothetical protein DL767_000626 [Monosporascus sp. MG133]
MVSPEPPRDLRDIAMAALSLNSSDVLAPCNPAIADDRLPEKDAVKGLVLLAQGHGPDSRQESDAMFGEPTPEEPEASEAGLPDPKVLLCEVCGNNERVKLPDGTITECRQCQNANKTRNTCLCIECGVNERVKYPSGTKTRCRECYTANNTRMERLRRAARVASGQCEVTGCHRLSDPSALKCSIHRRKQSDATKNLRAAQRAAGIPTATQRRRAARIEKNLCPRCGNHPPSPGLHMCKNCVDYTRAASRRSQEKKTRRWIADGFCSQCGKQPACPGRKRCERCTDYDKAARDKRQQKQHAQTGNEEKESEDPHS